MHRFHARVTLPSAQALAKLQLGAGYQFKVERQDAHSLVVEFSAEDLALADDLSASWQLDAAAADTLEVIAHRDPRHGAVAPDKGAPG